MPERDPRPARMRLMLGLAAALFVLIIGGMGLVWHLA